MALPSTDPVYYKEKIQKLICRAKDNEIRVKFEDSTITFSKIVNGGRLPRQRVVASVDLKKECRKL